MTSKRLVFGVGLNNADYQVDKTVWINGKQTLLWRCPYYIKWKGMLRRCYSKDRYKNCRVCKPWLEFMNFRMWLESLNIPEETLHNYDLDKDILGDGSLYSKDSCVLIPHVINTFILDKSSCSSECLRGVYRSNSSYIARCNNPLTREREYLGSFRDETTAHRVWCDRKQSLVDELTKHFNLPNNVRNSLIRKFSYDA